MIPTFKTLDKGGVGGEYKTGLSDTKKGFPPAKSEILHLITFFFLMHILLWTWFWNSSFDLQKEAELT